MLFKKAIDSIKKKYFKHKTASKTRKYQNSSDVIYSRLYGYRRNNDGRIEVVEKEAEVVRLVFQLLGQFKTPLQVKKILDLKDIRNRSKNRWTTQQLIGLVRPVFAGKIETKNGRLIDSTFYKSIIPLEDYKSAKKALQTQGLLPEWTEIYHLILSTESRNQVHS